MYKLLETNLKLFDNSLFKPKTSEELKKDKEAYREIKIEEWHENFLKREDIFKNPDGSYNVKRDVSCYNLNLNSLLELGIKFNIVNGDFDCSYNKLTTLEGAPQEVGRSFWCSHNKLTTLKGAPRKVGYNFHCYNNDLRTLEGAPEEVGERFWCMDNPKKFTEEEVREVSKVKGRVHV